MGDFEGRKSEPGIGDDLDERNDPSRRGEEPEESLPREGQSAPAREEPGDDAARPSGEGERRPSGEDVDSGNE